MYVSYKIRLFMYVCTLQNYLLLRKDKKDAKVHMLLKK